MLEEYEAEHPPQATAVQLPAIAEQPDLSCEQCNQIGSIIENKFQNAERDDVLEKMLNICGQFSSLSDGCANIVLTYFNDIYDHMRTNLNAQSICHMSGSCYANFHKHDVELEVMTHSDVGVVSVKDDVPCELCKQLVHHLK